MLAKIVTENGVKKIKPLTADIGAGVPVGTIVSMYKKSSPSGYLYCDGSTFDETAYPLLYAYLGSNVLPDYREFALVGAEQNTTDTIASHDVYAQGQAKDDQLQNITGNFETANRNRAPSTNGAFEATQGTENWFALDTQSTAPTIVKFDASRVARTGTVTRGKRKAVYFYIKATSGLPENQQDNVLATINANNSYSTTEHATGKKWIDGKPIYQKVVDIGALPNATTKTVAHNISNYSVFTTIKGIAFNSAKTAQIELPYITANNINTAITIEINATDVQIISGINRSSLSGYAILEYTKTTD